MDTFEIYNFGDRIQHTIEAEDYVHQDGYFIFENDERIKVYAIQDKFVKEIKVAKK